MFDRRQRIAAIVSSLQQRDLVAFFDPFIAVNGKRRSKLSICRYGANHSFPELLVDEVSSISIPVSTCFVSAMLLQEQFDNVGSSMRTLGPKSIPDAVKFQQQMPLFPERATKTLTVARQT